MRKFTLALFALSLIAIAYCVIEDPEESTTVYTPTDGTDMDITDLMATSEPTETSTDSGASVTSPSAMVAAIVMSLVAAIL